MSHRECHWLVLAVPIYHFPDFDGVDSVGSAGQDICDWNAYVFLYMIRQFMPSREEGCSGEVLSLSYHVKGVRSA